jgi:hypothetical protein
VKAGTALTRRRADECPRKADHQQEEEILFKANKRTLTAIAIITAATAPSAASARFDLNPSPRGVAIGQTQASRAASVQASPDESVLGQARAPSTTSSAHSVRVGSVAHCPPRAGRCVSPASVQADATSVHSALPTTAASQEGFLWSDAGIGAAGMFLLLSSGGAVAIAGRRSRHRATASRIFRGPSAENTAS